MSVDRKEITQILCGERIFGEAKDVIKALQDIVDGNPTATSIEIEAEWTGYEDVEYNINITRTETDKEQVERLASEEQDRLQREMDRAAKIRREEESKAIALRKLQVDYERNRTKIQKG